MDSVFYRYDGVDQADDGVSMPSDVLDARVSSACIGELLGRLERFTKDDSERKMYPWASRFVMGFPLPSWQRPLVWTQEQKTKFITSIWSGIDVGSYLVNDQYEFINLGTDQTVFREFSDVLLDGQQRLSALEAYVLNEFPVPDAHGIPRYWKDLPRIERRRFSNFQFARANIRSWDEQKLRMAYDLRAFGGTPHTEDQRASI